MTALNLLPLKTNGHFSSLFTIVFFCSLLIFLNPVNILAQDPDWAWVSSADGIRSDRGNSICSDASGNIYTTGDFRESITFGDITLTDNGIGDLFLVKNNSQGDVLWAISFGGTSLDFSNKVTSDGSGNIIITGAFRSESIIFGDYTLTNNGMEAFFIAKISPEGNVLWASSAFNENNCWGTSVDTDNDGNIIVTGSFSGASVVFGGTTLVNAYQFATDFFLVKYNDAGDVLWAQSFGDHTYDNSSGIYADNNGNINLTGTFLSNTITFGTTTLTNSGGRDYFLVQFNPSGGINWVRHATGDGDEMGSDVATDNAGNIFVSGTYTGTSVTFDTHTLPGNGYMNLFILKYNSGGDLAWVQSATGKYNDGAYGVTATDDGGVLVAGDFESDTLFFGNYSLINTLVEYGDIFVTKLNSEGLVSWAISAGGDESDWGKDVTTSGSGNIYVTGSFYSPEIFFGDIKIVNTSNNYYDLYIAKISSSTGISDNYFQSTYDIYPNPANDIITINTPAPVNVEITSIAGQCVLKTEVTADNATIDISNLTPGVYLVRIKTDEDIWVKKVIKE